MIVLNCPWCGPRNVTEFHHRGEVVPRPDPSTATPQEWRDYLYVRDNPAGWVTETWHHLSGCRRFFTLERDTVSNQTRPAPDTDPDAGPEPATTMQGGQF